jgi:hypothetical protein
VITETGTGTVVAVLLLESNIEPEYSVAGEPRLVLRQVRLFHCLASSNIRSSRSISICKCRAYSKSSISAVCGAKSLAVGLELL